MNCLETGFGLQASKTRRHSAIRCSALGVRGGEVRHPIMMRAALSTIVLACSACTFGLNPSLDVSQYAHTAWKVSDGFTQGAILAIAQTPDGYLWLGTEFGLYRFDGVRVVPWQAHAGQDLPSRIVHCLLAARDGTLWIGTTKALRLGRMES